MSYLSTASTNDFTIDGHRRRGRCLRPRYSGHPVISPDARPYSGFGNSYTLHVHTAGDGKEYTLLVHWLWKWIHPARPYCRRLKGIHPASPLAVELDTSCTSILPAMERDTPCTSIHLWWLWKWVRPGKSYTLHVHTVGVGGGERDTHCTSNCR